MNNYLIIALQKSYYLLLANKKL